MSGTASTEAYLDLMKRALSASLYDESAWIYLEPKRPPLSSLRKPTGYAWDLLRYVTLSALRKRSILGARVRPYQEEVRAEGRDWPCFGYTMIGRKRLDNVQACVEEVLRSDIPGDFLEAGAWRGGTSMFMRALLKVHGVEDRKVWVADSFEGLPVPKDASDGADFSGVDILKVSLDQVRANFARFNLLDDQVEFLPGWFSESLPNAPVKQLAILRLDGDMYSSTMDTLLAMHDRVSPGGYIIADDYHSWESCRRAVHDFLDERQLKPDIKTIDWAGAYWQKEP